MKLSPKFVIQIFLTLIILSPVIIYVSISYVNLTDDSDSHEPWVSFLGNPNESVYVSWETEEKCVGRILYGESADELDFQTSFEPQETKIHHIVLSSLKPNTKYFYKAEFEQSSSRIGSFTTAPNEPSSFKWVMFSDTQQPKIAPGHHQKIGGLIKDENYRFANIIGDWVDDGDDKELWNNFFNSGDSYTDSIAYAPVVGNHDRINRPSTYFNKYFINSVDTTDTQFYWSYDYGHVHFTMCSFTYGNENEFTAEQLEWIENDLANAQNSTFRIVMFHRPIVGAGYFGRSENLLGLNPNIGVNMTQMFLDYNVSATVHGHEHSYQRAQIGDMMHFVLGGGGGALDPGLRPQPETQFMTATPSYTEVSADVDSLTFRTIGIGGYLIDEYTINAPEQGGN